MLFPKVSRRTATQISLFLSVNFLFGPITQDEITWGNNGTSHMSRGSSSTPNSPPVKMVVKLTNERETQIGLFWKYDFRFQTEVDWSWDKIKCVQLHISWPPWSPLFLFCSVIIKKKTLKQFDNRCLILSSLFFQLMYTILIKSLNCSNHLKSLF